MFTLWALAAAAYGAALFGNARVDNSRIIKSTMGTMHWWKFRVLLKNHQSPNGNHQQRILVIGAWLLVILYILS
jgi:hypothetical protein